MNEVITVLKNKSGMELSFSNIGGVARALTVPDRDGRFGDVLLAPEKPMPSNQCGYMGAIIGRVANRITKSTFKLAGKTIRVTPNEPPEQPVNSLHGGREGFDAREWTVREMNSPDGPAAELTLLSPDGDQGYPGNLSVRVVYTLTNSNAWRIEYWAVTDATTVVNLTNHAYFSIDTCCRDIYNDLLTIYADSYSVPRTGLLPTGRIAPVKGTPLDFTHETPIGRRIKDPFPDLVTAGGYDHNYFLRQPKEGAFVRAARVRSPETGRVMECWTTEPCMQFYSSNFLDGVIGKQRISYHPRLALCLETQHAPDAPNHPGFPSIILRPGEVYYHKTEYRFSAK